MMMMMMMVSVKLQDGKEMVEAAGEHEGERACEC